MKCFYTDSRNKLSRTLPMVWFLLLFISFMAVRDHWNAFEIIVGMSVPALFWGVREYVEKIKSLLPK